MRSGPNKRKLGSSGYVSSYRTLLCSCRGVWKPTSHAGLEASSGKTQGERLVSPVSRFLLYHQYTLNVTSKVFSQLCKLSIRLQLIFQNLPFHILFTCNLSVLLTSKSCRVGNSRLNLSLAVGTVHLEKSMRNSVVLNPLSSEKVQILLAVCILANKSWVWDNLFFYLMVLFGFRELHLLPCQPTSHFAAFYKRTCISSFPFSPGINGSIHPAPSEQTPWEDLIPTPFHDRACCSWSMTSTVS